MRFSLRSSSPIGGPFRDHAPHGRTHTWTYPATQGRALLRKPPISVVRAILDVIVAHQNDTRAARPHPCSPSAPPRHRVSVEQEPAAQRDRHTGGRRQLLRAARVQPPARPHAEAPGQEPLLRAERHDPTLTRGRVVRPNVGVERDRSGRPSSLRRRTPRPP